jgi:hypothetical protein
MSEQIPFTTGALKDWPVIEEIVDQALAQALQGASGEDFRQEVLDNVRAVRGCEWFDDPNAMAASTSCKSHYNRGDRATTSS